MVMVRSIRSVKLLEIVLTLSSAAAAAAAAAAIGAGVVAAAFSRPSIPVDLSAAVSLSLVRVSSC
jgi:hypothetical protein